MPPALLTAIAVLLEGVSRKDLAVRAAKLSAAYRQGGTSDVIANQADALAYLVARMPATYAAIRAVMARVTEIVPEFDAVELSGCGRGAGHGGLGGAARCGRRLPYAGRAQRDLSRARGKVDAGC